MKLAFLITAAVLLGSIVAIAGLQQNTHVEALKGYDVKTPYYTIGNGVIKYKVIVDNDCWKSLYIRATPKFHNHILLNYQYIYNNKPTSSTSDFTYSGQMRFKTIKIEDATANDVDDPRIRVYITWKLIANDGDVYQGTDTQYVAYVKGQTTYELPRPFALHPDASECA